MPNALFDPKYYQLKSSEVLDFGWNPLVHYALIGSYYEIDPHPMFDTKWYKHTYDIQDRSLSPLAHYMKFGLRDPLNPNEYFNAEYYVQNHPESASYPGGPVAHYLQAGYLIGNNPSSRFNTRKYLKAYADVRAAVLNPLTHYLSHGRAEGRSPDPESRPLNSLLFRFGDAEYGRTGEIVKWDGNATLEDSFSLTIGVHLHLFYVDLAEEFCRQLSNIPAPFTLFVSVASNDADLGEIESIFGDFDTLILPERLESEIDYFCVSDCVRGGYGVFRIVEALYRDADPRRNARYVKTNLLRMFPGYDYVVWIDANVLFRGRVMEMIAELRASGHSIGAIPHPLREHCFDEALVCKEKKLDDPDLITVQMDRYIDFIDPKRDQLIETNFMIFEATDPRIGEFQRLWWNEINTYSLRDQLSVNYALCVAKVSWHPFLRERKSVRDTDKFAMFSHRLSGGAAPDGIYALWYRPGTHGNLPSLSNQQSKTRQTRTLDLDVVVCVHNALEDVTSCLASLETALNGRGRLVLVDDASDEPTARFLSEFSKRTGAVLVRHAERQGYTKAANAGVRATKAGRILLLNSDTIVPRRALDKLVEALDSDPLLGIVGPLSNAASFQSVPSIQGTKNQTAINALPPGMNTADISRPQPRPARQGAIDAAAAVEKTDACVNCNNKT